MIGCFADPYPDELLYSACARFQERMQHPNKKSTLQELFGTTNRRAAIDLPCNIGQLLKNLPPSHRYTIDQMIDCHTMLPVFIPFLPPERILALREDMKGAGGMAAHKRSGVMASRVPAPKRLRFCPICVDEDRKQPGETYWRRLHQVPGVEVCPEHQVFLEGSNPRNVSTRSYAQFVSAEDAVRTLPARRLDLSTRSHQILLMLARDVAWLLGRPDLRSDPNAIYGRYLKLLIARGLATYTGSIHVRKLLNEFKTHYVPTLLKLLHCELSGADQVKTNWLLRLVRPPRHAQHPLYHLLLIQFLGHSAEEFFRLSTELSFFGNGPWPCLNPVAGHFRQPVISEYKLSSRLRDGRPTANFRCGCGFAYARSGPDSSPEDRFRVGRVISFGPVWEAKLEKLWKDSSLSLSDVGRRLRVDTLTVRRHAARLKLPASRPGRRSKPLNCAALLKGNHDSTTHVEKRRVCRANWVSATRQTPKTTLKALRRKSPREYAWLLRNDTEWLKKHSPHSRRCGQPTSGVDWQRRDAEYAVAVRAVATRLKNNPGRPGWVTRSAIGKVVGAATLLRQKLHKMPLTAQVITNVVETRVEYAVRRVRWAAGCFICDHILPRPWQLLLRANVYSLRSVPEVKSAVDAAVDLIESNLSLKQELTA
jgi:hypothetical protein